MWSSELLTLKKTWYISSVYFDIAAICQPVIMQNAYAFDDALNSL